MALYADDCKAFRVVTCPNDQLMFQGDLDGVCACSKLKRMTFNVKKCKLMRITLKKQPLSSRVALNGYVLEKVDEFRDLSLLTNQHLSWNAITNKTNRP